MPRDELADALWGDAVPATWEKALSVLVSKLRALFTDAGVGGGAALTAAFGCYRLELPEGTWVDVLAAISAAQEAESLLATGRAEEATGRAALAESIARLPFLPGDDGPWVEAKRRELAEVRARALTVLAEAGIRAGTPSEAVRWAEQAVEAEQFRESGYRLLMSAHVAAGNRAEALRVYERCRRLLAAELGAYPSPETESIYRELLEAPAQEDVASTESAVAEERAPAGRSGGRPSHRALVLALLVLSGVAAAAFVLASPGTSAAKIRPDSVVRVDPRTLKVTEVAQVGDAPDFIVAAGGYLWVTNWILRDSASGSIRNAGDHSLWRVDPATGKAEQVGGGLSPCGLAADSSGDLWVANCFPPPSTQSSNVVRLDRKTNFGTPVPVPGGTNFFRGISFGGGSLWVGDSPGAQGDTDTVRQIDPQTGATQRTIRFARPPGALGWSARYGDLWATGFGDGSLTRIGAVAPSHRSFDAVVTNPDAVAFYGSGVWVGDWSSPDLVRLDATDPSHRHRVRLPVVNRRGCPRISCVWTLAAGAGAIWATMPRDRALWRVDPRTNRVRRIPLPFEPAGVTVNAGEVWVTVRGG